jgi:hypothetical protein
MGGSEIGGKLGVAMLPSTSEPRPLAPDLARRLVLAQADENGMAKEPLFRPAQIGDLGDQLRPDPMRPGQLQEPAEATVAIFLIASGWRRLCSVASVFWLMPVPTRPA